MCVCYWCAQYSQLTSWNIVQDYLVIIKRRLTSNPAIIVCVLLFVESSASNFFAFFFNLKNTERAENLWIFDCIYILGYQRYFGRDSFRSRDFRRLNLRFKEKVTEAFTGNPGDRFCLTPEDSSYNSPASSRPGPQLFLFSRSSACKRFRDLSPLIRSPWNAALVRSNSLQGFHPASNFLPLNRSQFYYIPPSDKKENLPALRVLQVHKFYSTINSKHLTCKKFSTIPSGFFVSLHAIPGRKILSFVPGVSTTSILCHSSETDLDARSIFSPRKNKKGRRRVCRISSLRDFS